MRKEKPELTIKRKNKYKNYAKWRFCLASFEIGKSPFIFLFNNDTIRLFKLYLYKAILTYLCALIYND